MKFLEKSAMVLVVCGLKSSLPCRTLEVLETMENLGDIIDVWSCPDVNEFAEDSAIKMYACEQKLTAFLETKVVNEKRIDAIVIDSTASYATGQILIRMFKSMKIRFGMLARDPKILAISHDEKETWRSILVNRFRTDVFLTDPVFKVDVSFKGTNSNTYLYSVVTDQKSKAVKNLMHSLAAIEKQSGVHANVEKFLGGGPTYEEEYIPTRVYTSDDYDHTSQLNQWSLQQPLAYQVIFQLELQGAEKLSESKIKIALGQTLSLLNSTANPSSTADLNEINTMSDGCIFVAFWSGCRVILIWDGRKHVDINLTTDQEDFEFILEFEKTFTNQIPAMKTVLRDEQPRGYGKVVSFIEDIEDEDYPEPFWA